MISKPPERVEESKAGATLQVPVTKLASKHKNEPPKTMKKMM
jgi:hypothetical protein